jgi:TetR/AcrR family transcriptional repressor of nem operon
LQKDFESLPDPVQQKVEEVSRLELSIMNEIIAEAQAEAIVSDLENVQLLSITILSSIKGALLYRRVLGDQVLNDVWSQINRFLGTR